MIEACFAELGPLVGTAAACRGSGKSQASHYRRLAPPVLDEGINIKIAQARLGHANPRTTLAIYAQATAEADRETARRVGERFRPPNNCGWLSNESKR